MVVEERTAAGNFLSALAASCLDPRLTGISPSLARPARHENFLNIHVLSLSYWFQLITSNNSSSMSALWAPHTSR